MKVTQFSLYQFANLVCPEGQTIAYLTHDLFIKFISCDHSELFEVHVPKPPALRLISGRTFDPALVVYQIQYPITDIWDSINGQPSTNYCRTD
jgi:hypothetical protein